MTDATVIATFSRRMRVERDDGVAIDARIKGKKLKPVCGDRVVVEDLAGEQEVLITAIHARENELARPNSRGKREVLAANIGLLVVVAAASPKADWFIVDRYLCAAELMGVPACVIYNKTDLGGAENYVDALAVYESVGLSTGTSSAADGSGITNLKSIIGDSTAIVVGQSGVGKSSLINLLADNADQRTAEISDKTGEGRHTTVNSVMIALPGGGRIIDSPGVRDYAPALASTDEAIIGYREVHHFGQHCRFSNCRHLREPDCAVKAAVDTGSINERRYESYRRTVALTERLTKERY